MWLDVKTNYAKTMSTCSRSERVGLDDPFCIISESSKTKQTREVFTIGRLLSLQKGERIELNSTVGDLEKFVKDNEKIESRLCKILENTGITIVSDFQVTW